MQSGYSAVWVDSPVAGRQPEFLGAVLIVAKHENSELADGDFATTDDPRFVVLSHPGETSILAETGYSWNDLLWQGRYVAVSNMACNECGTVFPRRRLGAPPATGCLPILVLSIAAAVGIGVWQHSFLLGLTTAWSSATFMVCFTFFAARVYVRWRFPTRDAALRLEQGCPHCGANDAKGIDAAKVAMCPHCRTRSMQFRSVGMS